jgi:ubiquinone/menaquinone biosynthesis C-methylase UbiE
MANNYATVTEVTGVGATQEQLSMLYTRYKFAAQLAEGKDVLEVACGAGQGLGYLAKSARSIVAGDIDDQVLRYAVDYYKGRGRIDLKGFDAQNLPFEDNRFDLVIFYEALYYLAQPDQFLQECSRVLRPNGVLLICTVNREWRDFNPSPFSTHYFSAQELVHWLRGHGFGAEILGAFPVRRDSLKDSIVSLAKRMAIALNVMPKTMQGKELLKRVFLGKLTPLPPEVVEGMAAYAPPVPIGDSSLTERFKVLYAVARIRKPQESAPKALSVDVNRRAQMDLTLST